MKKFLEWCFTIGTILLVLYSCSVGLPEVERIYKQLTSHEVYHPKINAWEKE